MTMRRIHPQVRDPFVEREQDSIFSGGGPRRHWVRNAAKPLLQDGVRFVAGGDEIGCQLVR